MSTDASDDAPLSFDAKPLRPLNPWSGRWVSIRAFDAGRDAEDFFESLCGPDEARLWKYIPFGPPESPAAVAEAFEGGAAALGWTPYVFRRPEDRRLLGTASHMRLRPGDGSAEVGAVIYSPLMQRSPAATEAMYRMARHVLGEHGYRRYEWKCDAENEASRRAAARLGFVHEGVFRQDMVVRGRNRDTAWFSILDREWPLVSRAFEAWLAAENFDAAGRQLRSLASFREQT